MQIPAAIRFLTAAGLAVSALLPARLVEAQSKATPAANSTTPFPASTLPATQPTTVPASSNPPPPSTPAQLPPRHAEVTYAGGTLFVSASNSSLNQILREISRETGIKITGGVADERVFGQYGPDAPAQILSTLLDGTGSNMLLVYGDGDVPTELFLSQRQGGPSSPNPNVRAFDETPETRDLSKEETHEPQAAEHPSPDQTRPVINSPVTPESPTAPANDSSQPQSPNGVKTPQQIYDQLQKLRQQSPAASPQ
jgi:hypothetical protein